MLNICLSIEDSLHNIQVPGTEKAEYLYSLINSLTDHDISFTCIAVDNGTIIFKDKNPITIEELMDNKTFVKIFKLDCPLQEFLALHANLSSKEIIESLSFQKNSISSFTKFSDGSVMMVKEIPQDNSCLFNAIHYAINGRFSDTGYLREIVTNDIKGNQAFYKSIIIDKSIDEYCDWIGDSKNWGGDIELKILSEYFSKEIAVISVNPLNIRIFGEKFGYRKRIYLLNTGRHYNLIVRNFMEGDSEMDVTVFQKDNAKNADIATEVSIMYMVDRFGKENEMIYCCDCQAKFMEEMIAVDHEKNTGHRLKFF